MFDLALRFQEWMDSGGPLIVLAAIPLFPLLTLVHELGHALAGLVLTEGLVRVKVGRNPPWLTGRLGRLVFELNPLSGKRAVAGWAATYAAMSRRESIAYSLAGPFANAFLALSLLPSLAAATGTAHALLLMTVVLSALTAIASLVPAELGDQRSDGLCVLDALRAKSPTPSAPPSNVDEFLRRFDQTRARWLVLLTDSKSTIRTPARGKNLAAVSGLLGFSDEPPCRATHALWHLAFAGWCWREVERGDRDRLADDLRAAAGAADDQLDLPVSRRASFMAATLVASDVELGAGCPGSSEKERMGFLARAFRESLSLFELPDEIDEEKYRHAFRFGVALHDAEWFLSKRRGAGQPPDA